MKSFNILKLPHYVCHQTIGRDHTPHHRMIAGILIMSVGVVIAKSANSFDAHWVHYVLDGVGYGVHGLGLTPFIESLME